MRIYIYLFFLMNVFSVKVVLSQTENQLPNYNPFKFKSSLPYQAIPFDKIKDEHYRPALIEGLMQLFHCSRPFRYLVEN